MTGQQDKKERPLSPRVSIYRWTMTMVASLAHRASGLALILFVPLYLWLLRGMTGSSENFEATSVWLHSGLGKVSLWIVGVALSYHFFNGIRFLTLDAGWGESRSAMRITAKLVLAVAAFTALTLMVIL